MLDADLVTRAVCSGFINEPSECKDLLKPRNPFEKYAGLAMPRSEGIGLGTLCLSLLIVGFLAFMGMVFYKKSLQKHMLTAIKEEVLLEMQAQMSYNKLASDF